MEILLLLLLVAWLIYAILVLMHGCTGYPSESFLAGLFIFFTFPLCVISIPLYFLDDFIASNRNYINFMRKAPHSNSIINAMVKDSLPLYTICLPITAIYSIMRFLIKSIWIVLSYYIFLPYKLKGKLAIVPPFSVYYCYSFDPHNIKPVDTTIATFDDIDHYNICLQGHTDWPMYYTEIVNINEKKWIFDYLSAVQKSDYKLCLFLNKNFWLDNERLSIIYVPEDCFFDKNLIDNGIFCFEKRFCDGKMSYYQIPALKLFSSYWIEPSSSLGFPTVYLNEVYALDNLGKELVGGRLFEKFFVKEIAELLDENPNNSVSLNKLY